METDIKHIQKELTTVESQWNQAIAANAVEEIGRYMSPDWVIIGTEGGIVSKSSFLEWVSSGDLVHSRMDFENLRIQIYGDTGVITARGTSAGTYKGEPFSFYEWATSVYIKQEGNWRCVLTMLTPAQKT